LPSWRWPIATQDAELGNGASSKAREELVIQEYFQETGIRAASAAEVELRRAEERRRDKAERQQEQQKREQERQYQRFLDDSRRVGSEVSANLQHADEAARRKAEYEKQAAESAERQARQAEQERVEREKNRWRSMYYQRSSSGSED
jgi:hypothetical protein